MLFIFRLIDIAERRQVLDNVLEFLPIPSAQRLLATEVRLWSALVRALATENNGESSSEYESYLHDSEEEEEEEKEVVDTQPPPLHTQFKRYRDDSGALVDPRVELAKKINWNSR